MDWRCSSSTKADASDKQLWLVVLFSIPGTVQDPKRRRFFAYSRQCRHEGYLATWKALQTANEPTHHWYR